MAEYVTFSFFRREGTITRSHSQCLGDSKFLKLLHLATLYSLHRSGGGGGGGGAVLTLRTRKPDALAVKRTLENLEIVHARLLLVCCTSSLLSRFD